MNGKILTLLVSLNVIHLSKQMPLNNARMELFLSALSGATNDVLRGIEECLEHYVSDSVLGGVENDGNEGKPESETTILFRILERCIRVSLHTGIEQKGHVLGDSKRQAANRDVVIPEIIDNEEDKISTEDPRSNFVDRLLVKLRALKQIFTTRNSSGVKRRFIQQKLNAKTAWRINQTKKESFGPPFPVGRFGK